MKRNLKKSGSFSQNLLIPLKIKLSNEEYSSAEDHREEIEKNCFGFSLNKAEMCAEINSIPSGIDNETAIDIFEGIVGKISDSTGTATKETESVFEKALYQASCKAAIKAGKQYASEHITWICEKLLSLPDIKFCPHGRPVAFEMSKHDFEHRFKRS